MEKIYGMHKLVGLQLFWSGTTTFSSGTPTFCQIGVLNSCFQNHSESSEFCISLSSSIRASDLFQDWWVEVTHEAKNGGSLSEMIGPSISN